MTPYSLTRFYNGEMVNQRFLNTSELQRSAQFDHVRTQDDATTRQPSQTESNVKGVLTRGTPPGPKRNPFIMSYLRMLMAGIAAPKKSCCGEFATVKI